MARAIPKWRITLFMIQAFSFSAVTSSYDCRRQSITCLNSGTCGSDGECSGCTDYEGYDCGLHTADKEANDCSGSTTCQNGATCYDSNNNDGSSVSCYCPPEYKGTECNEKRYTVTCTNTDMGVSITPYSTPSAVYQMDKKGSCDLTESSGDWTKSGISHSSDASCDSADTSTTDTFSRKFVVQDLSDRVTSADFVVTAVCTKDVTDGTATTSALDVTPYLGQAAVEKKFGDVILSSISPTTENINIGEQMTFTFTGGSELEEIRLDSLVADDNQGGTADTLISNGCRVAGKEAMVATNPAHPSTDKKVVEVTLRIFRFNSGPALKLTFTFKTCLSGDTTGCVTPSCSSRKKRDVSGAGILMNSSVIDVVFFPRDHDKYKGRFAENHHCAGADCNNIILPVVISGAALFLGVIAVGLLLLFLNRRKDKSKNTDYRSNDKIVSSY